ncbi:hypothetical protein R1sor_002597 [Riccia sorocarpa]|uniref:Uncharacterized protein n=1 Tax=Riccia sorocarpa TaxID=122646 RepID=A0ABD3H2F6_9MARC
MLDLLCPVRLELDAGSGDQGPDETQNSPARSDADNSPESEEEPVPIPENGLPGWIAPSRLEAELEEVDVSRKPQLEWKTHASSKMFCVLLRLGAPWYQDRLVRRQTLSKAINRYSMSEKEKARKELWRMQVKFDGGRWWEPVDPDSKKRRRNPKQANSEQAPPRN